MKEPRWLDAVFLTALHERMLAEFGGADGLRDAGRLTAAVERPPQAFAYGRTDLYELAACYAVAIIQGHPFLDGNKRTGFMAAVVFLEDNGFNFHADEPDAFLKTWALTAGELTEAQFAQWLRQSSDRKTPPQKH